MARAQFLSAFQASDFCFMPIQGPARNALAPGYLLAAPSALPSGRAFGATSYARTFGATSAHDVNRDELLPGDYKLSRRQLHLKYR
jgi:hypothetical protein